MRITRRRAIWTISILAGFMIMFASLYLLARSSRQSEWNEKVQPRTAEVRWGIIEALAECLDPTSDRCRAMPNFLPQSLWDNEACAAMVRNTLNYVFGEEVFDNAPAWTFAKVNEDRLTMVYNREHDFEVQGDRIVEIKDSGFQLTKLLSREDVYVLGYHYHETRSDEKIIAADTYMNSHLMLLLPRQKSGWWGYHLVHIGDDNPIRIDRIDEMPKLFDLVYIWRVEDLIRPKKIEEVVLYHNTLSYEVASRWLSLGMYSERFSSYIDTIAMWMANAVHETDQYPRTVLRSDPTPLAVVDPGNRKSCSHNDVLGFFHGEAIRCHNAESSRGKYGLENQCVEFVNRFLARYLGYRNLTMTGHAHSYYTGARRKGLRRFKNGGKEAPQEYDLLILRGEKGEKCGTFGHVAVISLVTDRNVCVVQQNTHPSIEPWHTCHKLNRSGDSFTVTGAFCPVIGWSRLPDQYLDKERKDEKIPPSSISGDGSGDADGRWRWLQRRCRRLQLPDDSDGCEVIGQQVVTPRDKLYRLVDAAHADLNATVACNPELKSAHLIYPNQVLTLCK